MLFVQNQSATRVRFIQDRLRPYFSAYSATKLSLLKSDIRAPLSNSPRGGDRAVLTGLCFHLEQGTGATPRHFRFPRRPREQGGNC